MTNWRIHDLRRTGASYLAKLKTAPYIIEKILDHVSGEISGVAAIYNRYGYDEEKRRALAHLGAVYSEYCIGRDRGSY